jgi:pimeloyl-ACP methyl ester carboxylesterase
MKRSSWRKLLRFAGLSLLLILIVFAVVAYRFISPKSDQQILQSFEGEKHQPHIELFDFNGKRIRVIQMQPELDTVLPCLVFVHGSPGSSMDFKRYLKDQDLNSRFNLVAYDRVGYSDRNPGIPLKSVEEEVELLHALLREYDLRKTTVVGYSYGGTVVMASPAEYRRKVALAAAVKGELEPVFWGLKLYQWSLTRPLLPGVIRAASEEKLRHIEELSGNDARWKASSAQVLAVHGKKDFIVPYQNSLYLAEILGDKLDLVTLEEGNHALVWTEFELIKKLLLEK